jgi:glycerophosphoryl diester phosphodiesterase
MSKYILFYSLIIMMSFQTQAQLDVQGHRGCRGLMPENTIPAMLRAIDLGVTTLEMDVVITSDNRVVLSHEPFMNAEISSRPDGTTFSTKEQKQYNIFRMTLAELQRWDVGMKPHPKFPRQQRIPAVKPLLEDVIDSVEAYVQQKGLKPMRYNIETKCQPATDEIYHPGPQRFAALLMEVVMKKKVSERVTIQSFDIRTLQVIHTSHPIMSLAYLIENTNKLAVEDNITRLGFTPAIYSPAFQLVDPKLLDACRKLGMKIVPWTVNDKENIDRLIAMGIDGLITDYPDLFQK